MRLIPILFALLLSPFGAQAAGLLGGPPSLEKSSFCKSYICEKPTLSIPHTEFTNYIFTVRGGANSWRIIQTARQGRVVSFRWTVDYQDNFMDLSTRQMLSRLTQTVTGVAMTASQIGQLEGMAMSGKTTARALGNGRMFTIIQRAGNARRFHFMLSNLSPQALAVAEPPRIHMTDAERAATLKRMKDKILYLLTFGDPKACPSGWVHITGLETLIAQPYSEQVDTIYELVERAAQDVGFTYDRSFHERFQGTSYELRPSKAGRLCLNVVNVMR